MPTSAALVMDEPAGHLGLPTADGRTLELPAATEGRTTVPVRRRPVELRGAAEVIAPDEGRVARRERCAELVAGPGPLRATAEREAEGIVHGGRLM